jgi:outer membrane protein W
MSRTLVGGLLAFLLFGTAPLARAQEPTLDGTVVSTTKPRVVYESLLGYGGIGFRGGTLKFLSDPDIKKDATPRLAGDLSFTYVYDDNLYLDLMIGYGWNRLGSDIERYVVSTVPMTVGARYIMLQRHRNQPFIGAGGGAYIWTIHTKDLGAGKDPVTFERLRRADLGFYVTGGVQRRMSQYITASADLSYHQILAENKADFPSGYNGNKSYVQARLGITFFFSLSERLDTALPQ